MRIQAVLGVQKHTGKTAEAFVREHLEKKRKSASRVVSDCGQGTEQRGLTRLCLQTEEGPFHIQYSSFFSNQADLSVVMTAGTPKELWPTFASTFDTMSEYQLLDMNHIDKQLKKDP